MCYYNTNKGEKTSSEYDKEDQKNKETVNACDRQTVNTRGGSFCIYECGKIICQSTYKQACTEQDLIKKVSTKLETRYQKLSPLVTQYAQELQILRNRYKHLGRNDMNFDCANFTTKILITRIEEKQIRSKDNEREKFERNANEKNKSADKNAN